jgi:hypothetical protein
LARIYKGYADLYFRYTDAPLLIVNADGIAPAGSDKEFRAVLTQISNTRGVRRSFSPLLFAT